MAFQDGDLLAALRIPDARGVVIGRRHHPLAVAAERRALHRSVWPFRTAISLPLSASQMRAVLSSRRRHHPLAVAAERRALHEAGMAFQDGDLLAALRIPDARGVVTRRRHHPLAVAAERRGQYDAGMAFQDGDLLAALRIPDARGVVVDAVTTRLPSPLNAALVTESVWPFRTAISLPLSASQMRAVLSSDAVTTRLPSPLNAALNTSRYGLSGRRSPCRSPHPRCARCCHRDAVTTRLPSPLNAAVRHLVGMAFQDGDLLAALRIPDARGVVARRRHHPLAVAAERRAYDRRRMSLEHAVQTREARRLPACLLVRLRTAWSKGGDHGPDRLAARNAWHGRSAHHSMLPWREP